ncbi:GAF domain-containing hybrid sensor histidine kinase/response regulator [Acidocella facilis]|uniref:GAF domain-containing hybrid sensor histidine kinase/response regulator n=1 Tax=Acidocella facilis TaxID=525 RepID=UPI001FD3555F|nr:ATP-binding protein [Acidocella facilis]
MSRLDQSEALRAAQSQPGPPLGPQAGWPYGLRLAARQCFSSPLPTAIYWGPAQLMLFNDKWAALHNVDRDSLHGLPAAMVWGEGWGRIQSHVLKLDQQEHVDFEQLHEVPGREGQSALWQYRLSPLHDECGGVAGIFEQGQEFSAQALEDERHALDILSRIAAATIVEKNPETIVQLVTDAGVELTGAAFGAFFYHITNEAGERMMLYTLSGAPREAFSHFPMPRRTALLTATFESTEIIRIDDIAADPRYGHNAPHSGMPRGHLPVASYMAVPVASREGGAIGTMLFGHPQRAQFSVRHEALMRGLAGQAAIAIENARLIQRVSDANETLEQRVAERTRELMDAHEALRQAQKMEAVGQLTGGIAHDFNNLLQGISGSLEMLERRLAQGRTSGLERFLHGAQAAAQRAAALTQRLLAFSRRQTLDPRPVDVGQLVAGLADLIQRAVGPSIRLEVLAPATPLRAAVDKAQLESALLNLAINGRDAMPDGGRLTIEVTTRWLDGRNARGAEIASGEYLAICVSDTGSGIPKELLGRVFDPFFTTKPIGQGTGLGLSMVHGFVRQSGGHVEIHSTPGLGTMVLLYLPCHHGDEIAEPAGAADPVLEAGKGARVLVIDDEAVVRAPIVAMLQEAGYKVVEAEDGASGLTLLRNTPQLQLLITDVGLPGGLNGRQVADAARQLMPGLKILFITGYAEQAALGTTALEEGMALFAKPFAMSNLAAQVADMLRAPPSAAARISA